MKNFLKNDKGGIVLLAVALIAVVVSLLSSISLLGIVQTDHLQTQYQNDMLQEELLLRSEAIRTVLSLEHDKYRPLPDRIVQIQSDDRLTTYNIDNRKEMTIISSFMGFASQEAVAIRTLITATRAQSFVIDIENKSPVKRFSERLMRNESLAEYQYFSHIEESENADGGGEAARVKFWGPDVLWGKVHSNDDIWIQQAGGGTNNGWPTFHEMVTTAGNFRYYPSGALLIGSGAPIESIFLGGWEEEVPAIVYEPTAIDIRANGMRPFGNANADIVYVRIEGSAYESWYGEIDLVGYEDFNVYSWYPMNAAHANAVINAGGNWFEDSDSIWTNHIAIYDTTWIPGPNGTVSNRSVFVENQQLWIEGDIRGKQTWGCADTIFIVGDITYQGTDIGQPPDEDPVNMIDYFGLVSEQKVLIRYKNIDPYNNFEIKDDNCTGIYLYGAFAAIGRGDENIHGTMTCHYDGIFTFQYHHGHGSTPNFMAPSPYISAEYTITLFDAGGDGWDDSSLDVIVEEEIILNDITCYGSENTYTFTVENGDIIETEYTPSGYANENEHTYEIYNQDGNLVASDGPFPGPGITYQVFLPAQEDILYTYIDFHKFIYPQSPFVPPNIEGFNLHGGDPTPCPWGTCGYPYESTAYLNSYPNDNPDAYVFPYGTDWPWYNPVWPESAANIVFERGIIHIFGAIAQTRRGFVHRSGSDPYNHPLGYANPSPWIIDNYKYDGCHPSAGYDKDYHYDDRFLYIQPPDYPEIYRGWGAGTLSSFDEKAWSFKVPPK